MPERPAASKERSSRHPANARFSLRTRGWRAAIRSKASAGHLVAHARTVAMTATPSTTGDHGFDGPTSDDPSADGGWITQWTESLFRPWRELPAVMRSVASQLISMAGRSAPPTEEVAARLDAVQSQLTARLEQAEILWRQELDAIRAATGTLQRRVAALEAQPREEAPQEDDETDVPRLPVHSPDAFRQVLSRAGEVAAQRGLTTGTDSATVVSDRGPEMHAEADPPAQRSQKAPRSRGRRP